MQDRQPPGESQPPATAMTPNAQRALTPGRLGAQDNLTAHQLDHPSAMVKRFGLAARWFAWLFFKPVQFPPRIISDIKGLAKEGSLVYVLSAISLLDYFYFNWAFVEAGLPLARFANGVSMTWLQPWRKGLFGWFRRRVLRRPQKPAEEVLHGLLRRREPVMLFLRRAFSLLDLLLARPQLGYLHELLDAQRALPHPLLIVPQLLVWERDPDRSRSTILEEFFGDPSAPGRLRKLVAFLLNHRRAQVRAGDPINLLEFLAEHPEPIEPSVLAEKLRVRIANALQQEDRVVRGVPVKPADQLRREILSDPEVVADLNELARQSNTPLAVVSREFDANLNEIAARYNMNVVAGFSFLLTLLWARIYEGIEIDEDGLERIRQAGKTAPVVVVPSHKSHIDYLLVSYVFYRAGLIPPHIAAGENLSFFPLGFLFRRAGAFFLRRSFSGQPVYSAAFRHYVRKLLSDGHWLEFFPEGGRSRTGKLLPPKFGLFKHVLEAVADGKSEDVILLPVNFGYERLIEEKAYRKELEGGEKRAESPVEVLKATSVLVHKYGRIRVQFGEPMSVRELLLEQGALQPAATRDAKAFDTALKICGFRVLGRINQAAVLTPTALVSAVLLTKVHKGITRGDLLLRVGYLLDLASRRGAVLSEPLVTAIQVRRQQILEAEGLDQKRQLEAGGEPDPFGLQAARAHAIGDAVGDVVDKALQLFESAKWILRRRFDDEDVLIVRAEGRMHLDYYKNNMLHVFVPDALLACAVLAKLQHGAAMTPAALHELTKFLSQLFRFEFVYEPGVTFEAQYARTLAGFVQAGWLLERDDGQLRVATSVRGALRLYAKLLQSFLESYDLMAKAVRLLDPARTPGAIALAEQTFLDRVQIDAQKSFDLGTVECYEAVSKVNLTNALRIFVEEGVLTQRSESVGKKRLKLLSFGGNEKSYRELQRMTGLLRELLAPWTIDRL